MEYFDISGLRGSVLGFGCGSLMGRVGRKHSLRALGAAWYQGINLFDIARSYGYGDAERLLGEFLRGRRDDAVVVTKFGIEPDPPPRWKRAARPVVRRVLDLAPSLRPMVRKAAAADRDADEFTVPLLRTSLEASLRALATDRVDVLLLHGPPHGVLEQDDLMAELEAVIDEGKVRVGGIAGGPVREAASDGPSVLKAIQLSVNMFDLDGIDIAAGSNRFFMANHPFGGRAGIRLGRERLRFVQHNVLGSTDLAVKLLDLDDDVLADVMLGLVLRDTGLHTAVPSMLSPGHLRCNVAAIERSRFTNHEIAVLRTALTTPFRNRTPAP